MNKLYLSTHFVFTLFASSFDITRYNPQIIIIAPMNHTKFVVSLKIKQPAIADRQKLAAVETIVGISALSSLE